MLSILRDRLLQIFSMLEVWNSTYFH